MMLESYRDTYMYGIPASYVSLTYFIGKRIQEFYSSNQQYLAVERFALRLFVMSNKSPIRLYKRRWGFYSHHEQSQWDLSQCGCDAKDTH